MGSSTLRKLGLLGSLYFAQGLPYGFFTQALPVLLRHEGYSLGQIGLTALLAMPWALKFLWAPLVDRFGSERFGWRRSWILPLQGLSALVLFGLALRPPAASVAFLLAAVFVTNGLAATQDIATDGLAVDLLALEERGLANGIQVGGYRVGMIMGGGALLILFDRLGWGPAFGAMAACVVISTLPILFLREPPRRLAEVGGSPKVHFLRRPGAASLVALLILYKAGEAFAGGMLRPFLTDQGFGLSDIGKLLGTVGFLAGLLGALTGGALVGRWGRYRSLIGFGMAQTVALLGYAYLSAVGGSVALTYVLCATELFASGMATVALFTCMMDWCLEGSSATDYTVQASAVVIATGGAASVSGYSAERFGYTAHFMASAMISLVAVGAVVLWFPGRRQGAPTPD